MPGRRGRIGAGVAVSSASAVGWAYAALPRGAPAPERFRVRFVYTTSAFLQRIFSIKFRIFMNESIHDAVPGRAASETRAWVRAVISRARAANLRSSSFGCVSACVAEVAVRPISPCSLGR